MTYDVPPPNAMPGDTQARFSLAASTRTRRHPVQRRLTGLLLTLLAICLLSACERAAPAAPGAVPVRLETVGSRAPASDVSLPGIVAARTESQLGLRVSGRLSARPVDRGSSVKAGAVLATLDPIPLQLAVQAAEAQLAQARSALEQAGSDVTRNQQLVARGAIAKADFERMQTAQTSAAAQVRAAASQLERARTDLADATLRAPHDGIITAVWAEPGQVIAAGAPVVSLAYAGELEVQADVPEHLIASLAPGTGAQVALLEQPEHRFPATVREAAPAADPVTRTFRIRLTVPALSPSARLGMSTTVTLPRATQDEAATWTLPLSALLQHEGATAVWVLPPGADHLVLRPVTIGRLGTDHVTILGGLEAGERVVTAGVHRLDAGLVVTPWDGRLP
ncbi:efflux RND transporter periplasmic adaptor subunit [Kerstersia similis]|uniref:efflux RND transporter periplasmic adaptor subunit n=1 Tax=Kerstersia similis TaxID=206505 RepID=UPI0039F070FC